MVNYREILRMTADGSYGIRQIKADAHCSYEKIRKTQEAAKAKGIRWPLDDDVSNEELQKWLFLHRQTCGEYRGRNTGVPGKPGRRMKSV